MTFQTLHLLSTNTIFHPFVCSLVGQRRLITDKPNFRLLESRFRLKFHNILPSVQHFVIVCEVYLYWKCRCLLLRQFSKLIYTMRVLNMRRGGLKKNIITTMIIQYLHSSSFVYGNSLIILINHDYVHNLLLI